MSSVSCAMRFCFASGSDAIVRMLCRRSASLISRTRTSLAIATSILRIVAACCASRESNSSRSSLVTPSTIAATSSPNSRHEVGERDRRVLDRVVQQRAGERDVVETEVGEDHRDAERMRDVRVARAPDLVAVRVARDLVGALDQRDVGAVVPRAHRVDQRPHASRPRSTAGAAVATGSPRSSRALTHTRPPRGRR